MRRKPPKGSTRAPVLGAAPGCLHEAAVPVELLATGERVAQLCPHCWAQLPVDWIPEAQKRLLLLAQEPLSRRFFENRSPRAWCGVSPNAIAIPRGPEELAELLGDGARLATFFTREAVTGGITKELLRRYGEAKTRGEM